MTSRSERLQLVRKRRRRRLKLSATVVVATLGALFAFVAAGSGSGAGAAPVAGGYFQVLPPGSALPSEADCAARVRRSAWEPRADNYAANHASVSNTLANFSQFTGAWNGQYRPRINGNFHGTTDEIIQFYACKWGWSDNLVRAEAVIESTWRQSTVGDGGTSYGLMQVRYLYHPNVNGTKCKSCTGSSWPNSANSTAFNVDLFLAEMRGCYDGMEPYLGNTRGDEWGCIGSWFSGAWRTSSSLNYISKVQGALNNKAWLGWPDQSGSLPAQPNRSQATLPPVTRASTTVAGGGRPNAQRQTTTTTAQPATPRQPQVTTTTVAAPAPAKTPHLNELRKLRRELNNYCKKNSC